MNDAALPVFDSRPVRLIPCWIALAVLWVFGSLSHSGFVEWDDPSTLARNPHFNPASIESVLHYWREPHMGLYVPVTYTAWGAIAKVAQGELANGVGSQLKAAPFHTANILLHICAACVVYAILRQLTKKPWPAALGALLFALHPVQVEPVAWVSGMKDLLCGLLSLIAIWQYIRYARRSDGTRGSQVDVCGSEGGAEQRSWRSATCGKGWGALATIAFGLAMLSKPTAIVLPLIVFALDRWMLGRSFKRAIVLPAVWCLLALPIAVVTGHVQLSSATPQVAIWQRPLVAGDALAFYVGHVALPLELAVDYARRPGVVLGSSMVYVIWLIPAAVALLVLGRRRQFPWLIAASVAFLAPLLPVLGLRPFMMQYTSTVADHYLYLPMFGLALALAMFLAAKQNVRWNSLCALLIAVFALRSGTQTKYWKDDESLNRHTLEVTPESFTAHINLAHDLELKGDFKGELQEDAAAVRCNPDFALARGNYAVMLATLGHVNAAEAQCRELSRLIKPLPAGGQKIFTPTFAFVGRELLWHHDPVRAAALLKQALRLDPTCADAAADLRDAQASLDPEP